MSVAIDSSRLYRWPSELVELVEAVTRTDPNNESTWIEWKSALDLNDRSGHQHIAKQVLGFANRTVATARHHTGGYAYLVVGAEPGNVAGIVPVDPADLHPRIVRYVGPAVRWRAEYVPVQGHQVLVVVVDPPGNGDPIHPVRQQLGEHPRGRILVRRPGKTEPANDFEIDQLVQRVRAGQGALEFTVEPVSPLIECNPGLPDSEELTETERSAVLARPRANARLVPGLSGLPQGTAFAGLFTSPDDRSDEDYTRQVDEYCQDYRMADERLFVWRLWRHQPAWLRLEAVNLTADNFTDIELQIHVPGAVRRWPEELEEMAEDERPELPDRPAVLGTLKPNSLLGLGDNSIFSAPHYPELRQASFGPAGPSYTVRDGGSVTITFEELHLRPGQRRQLPGVPLLVDATEGTVLDCEWQATASNVSGQRTGTFTLTVGPSTLKFNLSEIEQTAAAEQDEPGVSH